MSATHENTIVVNISIVPNPVPQDSFGRVLLLVNEDATSPNSLNGNRTVLYQSPEAAVADNTAGYINATTLASLQALFAQTPRPSSVRVGKVQTGAVELETYAAGLAAVEAVAADFYAIVIDSRADADIVSVSNAVQTGGKYVFIAQSDDADLKTASLPAGLASLASNTRTAVLYHDTDTVPADIAWVASRVVFDPNLASAPWDGPVADVTAHATAVTAAERDAIVGNNVNVGLPYSTATYFVSPGVSLTGRPLYETLTADWFRAELTARIAALRLRYTARGRKLQVGPTGQAAVLGELEGLLTLGEEAGHFLAGQTTATAEAITDADRTARRLRFSAAAQSAQSAVNFEFNLIVQNTPVVVEA
ncbi:MAG: hypothetical protein AAGA48_27600 [Myxococcota bacterium]